MEILGLHVVWYVVGGFAAFLVWKIVESKKNRTGGHDITPTPGPGTKKQK